VALAGGFPFKKGDFEGTVPSSKKMGPGEFEMQVRDPKFSVFTQLAVCLPLKHKRVLVSILI